MADIFPDDIFKCVFLFENVWIWIKISLKCVPTVRIINIPALVQIMAWCRIGDKPLSEPMMVNLLTHFCDTQPQWAKKSSCFPRSFLTDCYVVVSMDTILMCGFGFTIYDNDEYSICPHHAYDIPCQLCSEAFHLKCISIVPEDI